jgi:hypothetical protein
MKGMRLAVIAAVVLSGCGGGRGEISGVVRYQGKPLTGATITFHDETGGAFPAVIDKEGAYKVRNVPVGTARVVITVPLAISIPGLEDTPLPTFPEALAKFARPETSGLECDVVAGTQSYDPKLD